MINTANTPNGPNTANKGRPVLSRRTLNRSLLARQLLLERSDMPVTTAVEHLVGLQAQKPDPPHVGLWTRLGTIRTADVGGLLDARRLVRIAAMRSTIHLLTAADALALRPVIQPLLDRELRPRSTHRWLAWTSAPWSGSVAGCAPGSH
jgi:hypothetical protein